MKKAIYFTLVIMISILNTIAGIEILASAIFYAFDHPIIASKYDKWFIPVYITTNYLIVILFNRFILNRFKITKKNKTIEFTIMFPIIFLCLVLIGLLTGIFELEKIKFIF